jgi:hypothetical protein|tara:strand:- start:534 stop:728 length:195 start_codon:yes stop_codon:yes gene_type:complete
MATKGIISGIIVLLVGWTLLSHIGLKMWENLFTYLLIAISTTALPYAIYDDYLKGHENEGGKDE